MRLSDFDYHLPPEQIAQHPLPDRSASRLLVVDRTSGETRHLHFHDLLTLIPPGDLLVINTSRVIPARLRGKREGGQAAEFLLVRELADGTWLAMAHPGGKLKPGRRVTIGDDSVVEILEVLGGGLRRVRFVGVRDARATLEKYGEVPLPPYIRRPPDREDRDRYQTVFAAHDGSVAAPTAGLHFTTELLARIHEQRTLVTAIDLHVGPGTFKPVETDELDKHLMHPEAYEISEGAANWVNKVKGVGSAVWAVGTTVVRALESAVNPQGEVHGGVGETSLFIRPPYEFKIVDHLITNFHLPRSTLLMLVCAFGGYDRVMNAYREAVNASYRFYSYGDAMLII